MVEIRPYSESKEIVGARRLLKEGKFKEALLLLEDLEENVVLTDSDQLSCHLLKSDIYMCYGNHEESLKYSQKAYQESIALKNHLFSIDALLIMARALTHLGDLEKALNIAIQGEDELKNLSNISTPESEKREAYIAGVKGSISWFTGDINQANMYAKRSLELCEKLGYKDGLVVILFFIGVSNVLSKIDLKYAQKMLERGLTLAEEINHPYGKSNYPAVLGIVCALKGDFKESLRYYTKALPIFKENNNKHWYSATLNNMSESYIGLGDYDNALLCIKQSIELAKDSGNYLHMSAFIGTMIEVLLNKGDIEQAHKYLEQLEKMCKKEDNKMMENDYIMNKALLLKASPRIRDRAKAEELFKKIIDSKLVMSEIKINALLYLCELLLDEIQITHELEILEEINPHITQLLDIANKSSSYWVLAETYTLQAKLALLTLDLNGARRLLTKAQKIAETHGMIHLASKISIEHDSLLKELDKWENLEESEDILKERFELAKLKEQMAHMLKKRPIEFPKASEEDPVTILVITEGGTPLFSHSFIEGKEFESSLFSGFLTTIDYFMKEMFSEGLDRFIFGDYTLLMKSVAPFFICYIFKGESYYALQRIKYFVENVQKEGLWQKLIKFFQSNRSIHLKDIPMLESLITETFINKSIVFSEL